MDLVEVNGDFAPQYLAVEKNLDFNPSKTNINGRAIIWNQQDLDQELLHTQFMN